MRLTVLVGQHNTVVTVIGEVGWQQIAKSHAINVTVMFFRAFCSISWIFEICTKKLKCWFLINNNLCSNGNFGTFMQANCMKTCGFCQSIPGTWFSYLPFTGIMKVRSVLNLKQNTPRNSPKPKPGTRGIGFSFPDKLPFPESLKNENCRGIGIPRCKG